MLPFRTSAGAAKTPRRVTAGGIFESPPPPTPVSTGGIFAPGGGSRWRRWHSLCSGRRHPAGVRRRRRRQQRQITWRRRITWPQHRPTVVGGGGSFGRATSEASHGLSSKPLRSWHTSQATGGGGCCSGCSGRSACRATAISAATGVSSALAVRCEGGRLTLAAAKEAQQLLSASEGGASTCCIPPFIPHCNSCTTSSGPCYCCVRVDCWH